ncbi:MAG: DUF4065 domain-containing protein [Sphingobacteriales bacterium JAD_PAG50586_3]|nr:MAG: DUF4065 domain-containing protein [Sphingobacteriales bacterium JAD_PAG50586_3]
MAYKAIEIAAAFIKKGKAEKKPFSQMKLQCMVYYAHGYYLALNNEPLFTEAIEAWEIGPAIQSIYGMYRLIDRLPIAEWPDDNFDIDYEPKTIQAIDAAWEAAFRLTSDQFIKWVTAKGSPWAKSYSPIQWTLNISNDTVKSYFEKEVLRMA